VSSTPNGSLGPFELPENKLNVSEVAVTDLDMSPPRGNPFPVVGIGASAGGLEAFGQLLAALPPDTGMAFVLVQHLDPQHESLLAEILAQRSPVPVITVRDGMSIEPNHVYVIPPNTSMVLQDRHLCLAPREAGLHLPIDIFFRSLARTQGGRAIGVVLSGNASDGSMGLRAIKAECGITFAQDELTARFSGMPRNAVSTGAVDFVLPPDEIAQELGRMGHNPLLVVRRPGQAATETLPDGDGELKRIFALLHASSKVDFSHYKLATVRRRIGRRMLVLHMQNMAEYARYCERNTAELFELYRDLLISVTSFFRDPESFEVLIRSLSPLFIDRAQSDQPVRVWIPGCATGEEIYSHAIWIHELFHQHDLRGPIQLFGTDISEFALERARQGVYPETIKDDLTADRLARFFTKTDGKYQIRKELRENCVFARHDVTRDPPFSRLDLVSCRNVLIYLDGGVHRRIFPVFHYALNENGILMLGSAESAESVPELFGTLDKSHRLYARRGGPARIALEPVPDRVTAEFNSSSDSKVPPLSSADLQKRVDRLVQTKYSPPAVLVDESLQILQFRGHTSAYLDPTPGEASLNLLRMARESMVLPLRRAIQAAAEKKVTVQETDVSVENGQHRQEITLEVTPVAGSTPAEHYYLVVFLSSPSAAAWAVDGALSPASLSDVASARLTRELAETREYLRNLTEDYEANAEELRAANEEARSANEELQSANEELGTTKEELQSTNEELTTVNEELQSRNTELSATNSDFKNLLASVSVAILMIDHDLRVRRFNAAAEKLLELAAHDIGRPVGHLRGRIETPMIEEQVRSVIESLHPFQQEVQDVDGHWFSLTIRPYRTLDNRITGAVVTLQDIDPLKRAVEAAEEARDYAEGMIETVREPLVVLDADLRVQRATPAFYETFLVSREETEGRLLYDLGNGQWNRPRLRELLGSALFRQQPFHDFQVEHEFPHIGRRIMRLNARRIPRQDPEHRKLLLAIEDVTERREEAEIRFQRMFEAAKDGMVLVDGETEVITEVNPCFLDLTRFEREEVVGKRFAEAGPFYESAGLVDITVATKQQETVRRDDVALLTRLGAEVCVDVTANRYRVGTQPVVQLNIRDITARKKATDALRETQERFRLFVESVRDYALFQLDSDGFIVAWNTGAERLLGWSESEVIGKPSELVFVPEDVEKGEARRELETARLEGRAQDERWHIRKDGSRFFASGVLTRVSDDAGRLRGFAKIMRDITETNEYQEQLRRSVAEKSVLVREIHHRVKNNLQVIVSLLSLQSNQINNPELLAAFEETEARVRAIAQIHERLYASDDLTEVEFGAYLSHLSKELLMIFATGSESVDLVLNVQEMVLHIEQAIPLGLIANEVIINSLKHGLKGTGGKLDVSLSYVRDGIHPELGETLDDGWAQIRIADNGPGLPPDLELASSSSMGFRLVNLLTTQLRGRLEIGPGPGAEITLTFPLS